MWWPHSPEETFAGSILPLAASCSCVFFRGSVDVVQPQPGFFAIWTMVEGLTCKVMGVAFKKPEDIEEGKPRTDLGEGTDDWAQLTAKRLKRCIKWMTLPHNTFACTAGVLSLDPLQRLLFWIFKHESKCYPDMCQQASMLKFAGCLEDVASDPSVYEPAAVHLARGDYVNGLLASGIAALLPDGDPKLPDHVQAFRDISSTSRARTSPILCLWSALLPALAQLWYRFAIYFSRWPFKLLVLVSSAVSAEEKVRVVTQFLQALECCLDAGCSRPFLAFLKGKLGSFQEKVDFLMSEYFLNILKTWAHSISISVFDLECNKRCIQERLQWGTASRFLHVCSQGLHPGSHAII